MQCPDCSGYRHSGPCEDLHAIYLKAFDAMMAYQDKFPPAHRTLEQTNYLSKLTSICGDAKYKYDTAKMKEWERGQV